MYSKEHPFRRLVIASYRLPFRFTRTASGFKAVQNSGGLVSAVLSLSERMRSDQEAGMTEKIVWTGIADNIPVDVAPAEWENDRFDLEPVRLNRKLNDQFYGGFSNDLIWPLFHYFSTYCIFNPAYFEAYREANALFCEQIVSRYRPGDYIWVHDYHLMLLPQMIRERIPEAPIGFFLHIPFPSFEVFRLLPRIWREAIVQGMLGADLVGFHTHDYTQHFIKCVKRATGFECHQNVLFTADRIVKADAFPIGIDYHKFHDATSLHEVVAARAKIVHALGGQKLVFSVDRLDYTKGLLLRLQGFEAFLEEHAEWHTRVTFNMVVVPSRANIEKYKKMKKEIESTVGRINGKYSTLSWRPVIYQYKSLPFAELVALYNASDVALITPLRDGMNLVAKEYVACQTEQKGVLILSEMAGAAAEMNEALIINPADHHEVACAIATALEMSPVEKEARILRMQERLAHCNVFTWASGFFSQTYEIIGRQKQLSVRLVNREITSRMVQSYQAASHRILFLDYDGTLVSLVRRPELATIQKNTLDLIRRLSADPCNRVVIISGRDKDFLQQQFQDAPVTLVAEHGYFVKHPDKDWIRTVRADESWKESVRQILAEYVNRCAGTFIEEKSGSLAWHYRNTELDFAQLRLHELQDDLSELIRHNSDLEILEGHKVVEIKSRRYNKRVAAATLMGNRNFDFVLAAGDDKTDEFLFQAMPAEAFTIRVGFCPSVARFNVPNPAMLLKLLRSLN